MIALTADKKEADSCLGALPDSLSTGGFTRASRNNPNSSGQYRIHLGTIKHIKFILLFMIAVTYL